MDEVADENDLEEIEARLYSEFYHSRHDEELPGDAGQVGEAHSYSTWRSAFRYFKSPHVEQPVEFDPAIEERHMVRYGGPMAPPDAFYRERRNELFNGALNEFVRPDERMYTRGITEETRKFLHSQKKKKAKKQKNRPKHNAKRYNTRQIQYQPPDQQQPQKINSTIFISDESDDDCMIIQDKENNKNDNTATNDNHDDDDNDDDIIYIPPPPPVIIPIDEDDEENIDAVETTDDSTRKESPNDFLECCGSENDFNFGLHGSEFKNQVESISPNKVADYCETESSSSTIEPGRSFNNTVKTIVFNEVEFPKGDIFAENNLGTFESLITTRREDDHVSSSRVEEEQSKGDGNDADNADSRSSSSESDYEVQNNSKTPLPHLSFMDEGNLETGKRKQDSGPEKVADKKKPAKKKKKKTKAVSGDEESTDSTKNKKDKSTSKKKKNDGETVDGTDGTKKKKSFLHDPDDKNDSTSTDHPKRKKKSSETVDETAATIEGDGTPASNPDNAEIDSNAMEEKSRTPSIDPDHPKKKKKSLSESAVEDTGTNVETTTSQTEGDDHKRKKKTSLIEPTTETVEEESSNEVIIIEENRHFYEVIDSPVSNDLDDTRDIIIVEDDLNLANCQIRRPKASTTEFDVLEIQRRQSDDPSKWQILDIDRRLPKLLGAQDVGPRCKKCRHFGHFASRCPDKPGPIPCKLCGGINHQEPRCPEKQCRQCGQGKGYYSTSYCHMCAKYRYLNCGICHMRGHLDSACPDLWRRYHSTTDEGPLVIPQGPLLKPRDQQWCSGCARRGHLEHECNYYNREYPPTTPIVMEYRDTFYDGRVSTTAPHDIPSLLLVDVPKPTVTDEDRIVVSIPTSSNLKIQIGNSGPSAPIGDKKWQPTYDDLSHGRDVKHIKLLFMTHPVAEIRRHLEIELAILRDKVAFCSPRLLRDKLYKMERYKTEVGVSRLWYRVLNMYIFGVHQCREGKLHISYIMKVLDAPKMDMSKRRTLYGAYNYIFGSEKHKDFNYFLTIKRLVQKYDDDQASK